MTPLTADAAIVNFNARTSLRECLESVRVADGIDTILVADNGSTDGSLDMVRSEYPDVIAVSLPHNPGYGAAVNELARRSSAEALLVLNADVRVSPGAAAQMLERLDAHPTTAIVGPMVVDRAGTPQRTWYRDHSIGQLLWWETGLWHLRRGHYSDELAQLADAGPFAAPWVTGAAFVARRAVFDAVEGFDPNFFLYFEELDLCRRVRAAGWEVEVLPSATVVHGKGVSADQQPVRSLRTRYRSMSYYHRKHHSAPQVVLRASVAAVMGARLVRDGATTVWRRLRRDNTPTSASASWAVLVDALRGWETA